MKSLFQSTTVRPSINQNQYLQQIGELFLNLAEIYGKVFNFFLAMATVSNVLSSLTT